MGKHVVAAIAAWILCASSAGAATRPEKVLLWPGGAPGAVADGGEEQVRVTGQGEHVVSNVHQPSITIYLPSAKVTRTAVIVVPGGGYRELWTDHEGHAVAEYLRGRGIAAFVLFYRLPNQQGSTYKREVEPFADIGRAIRTVRSRATEWSIDPKKIGVLGFSAGGHLVMQAATKFDAGDPAATDPIDRVDSRPDFAAPIYTGMSSEWKIDANTPPMFLLCGSDDRPVVLTAMTQIYLALRAAKVPAELHIYDDIGHGFGLRASNTGPVTNWPNQFVDWLRVRKIYQENPQ